MKCVGVVLISLMLLSQGLLAQQMVSPVQVTIKASGTKRTEARSLEITVTNTSGKPLADTMLRWGVARTEEANVYLRSAGSVRLAQKTFGADVPLELRPGEQRVIQTTTIQAVPNDQYSTIDGYGVQILVKGQIVMEQMYPPSIKKVFSYFNPAEAAAPKNVPVFANKPKMIPGMANPARAVLGADDLRPLCQVSAGSHEAVCREMKIKTGKNVFLITHALDWEVNQPGQSLSIRFDAPSADYYNLFLHVIKARESGRFQFSINNQQPLKEDLDLQNPNGFLQEIIDLGPIELLEKENVLRITPCNKNGIITKCNILFERLQMKEIPLESRPGMAVRVELRDAEGKPVAQQAGNAATALKVEREYQPGDKIVISGPKEMALRLDAMLPEAWVYAPNGSVEFPVPTGKDHNAYAPNIFSGSTHTISVRALPQRETARYRNVALNPVDTRGTAIAYPHATSNSEWHGEAVFAACNAIDGTILNTRHGGWPYQSWGPEKRTDLWWKVEFGRPVEIDKLVLYIRADFPHDGFWQTATIEFSDGSHEEISIKKTAEKQVFTFDKRKASWLQLTNLVPADPLQWCALTEVEVWGQPASKEVNSQVSRSANP